MRIETPLIALILGGVIFAGMFAFIFSLADDNNMTYDVSKLDSNETTFSNAFNVVNESKAEMDDIINDFEDQTITDSGSLFGFVSLAFNVGKQFFGSLNIFKNMAIMAGHTLGLPAWIAGALISILLITMIVTIILLIAGRVQ